MVLKKTSTGFIHLNIGWNAEPNAPSPVVKIDGDDLVLTFYLNPFVYDEFQADDIGSVRFFSCSRHRFTNVNDEGWYRGQCRFSGIAPAWGEFYEVIGDFRERSVDCEWNTHRAKNGMDRNFLFYFKDNTFECSASHWAFDQNSRNSLKDFQIPETDQRQQS